tara:strand:+ start:877 stop:1479 length:603 start_codon:yes stop_codon:yes gene_type:complete
MEQSESTNELATALAKAQSEIRNPGKNTKNTFFKNEYADLTSVLGCIRPAASANGLSFIQAVEAQHGFVSVSSQIFHGSGQWIRQTASLKIAETSKNPIQDFGSMATYLKRYQAQSMWAVCADEDTDAQDLGIEDISDEKVAHLDAMLSSTNSNKASFLNVYNVENLKSLTDAQYEKAKKQLQQKKANQAINIISGRSNE